MNNNTPKMVVVGWDSADWDIISPMMDAGELPMMKGLVEKGASGKLRTLEPVLSPMLWTSIATGQLADKHGVLGFTEVDSLTGKVRPVVAASRKCPAVWDILAAQGYRCHTIGWFATHGGTIPNGSVVSNFFPAPTAPPGEPWPPSSAGSVWPAENAAELDALRVSPELVDGNMVGMFCPRWEEIDLAKDHKLNHLRMHLAEAFTIQAATCWTLQNTEWDFVAVYFRAMDEIAHHFMAYHPPRMDGLSEREYELYREVMRSTYRLHDLMLARIAALCPRDVHLLVVSDHGFHSGKDRPRFVPHVPAGITIWHRDHGVLVAAGPQFKPDSLLHGAGLLDIAPTILEVFGLPAGQDMPGRVLTDAFANSKDRPQARIPSWEERLPKPVRSIQWLSEEENQTLIAQFVALGYLDKPTGDLDRDAAGTLRENRWTLARCYLASGRKVEALPILAELYRDIPERTDFAQTLARCQADCGLFAEAEETLEAILETASNQPVAELLRAQISLACGDAEKALLHVEKARHTPVGQQARFWSQLAQVLLRLKRWPEALEAADCLRALDPDDALAPLLRASALLALRQLEDARQAALAAIALDYATPRAHLILALACLRMGEKNRALQAARTAAELAPEAPRALRVLAVVLRANSLTRESREVLALKRFFLSERKRQIKELREKLRTIPRKLPASISPSPSVAVEEIPDASNETRSLENSDSPLPDAPIVIVTGLPRSGTSLMMQMLQAGGLPLLTDGVRSADRHNTEGYYEWEPIRQLPRQPSLIDHAVGKAVKVVTPLIPHLPSQRTYRFLFMLRPLEEVANSQNIMRQALAGDGAESVLPLLNKHLQTVRQLLAGTPAEVLEIDYPSLVASPGDWVSKVVEFLGSERLPTASAMVHCIKPSLYRQRRVKI